MDPDRNANQVIWLSVCVLTKYNYELCLVTSQQRKSSCVHAARKKLQQSRFKLLELVLRRHPHLGIRIGESTAHTSPLLTHTSRQVRAKLASLQDLVTNYPRAWRIQRLRSSPDRQRRAARGQLSPPTPPPARRAPAALEDSERLRRLADQQLQVAPCQSPSVALLFETGSALAYIAAAALALSG